LEIKLEKWKQKDETKKVSSEIAILVTPSSIPSIGSVPWTRVVFGS